VSTIIIITHPNTNPQVVRTDTGADIVDEHGETRATFVSYDAAIAYLNSLKGIEG
jgi:hypothetical protein